MEPTDEFKLVSRIMNRLEIRILFSVMLSGAAGNHKVGYGNAKHRDAGYMAACTTQRRD